jgi:hypothetical protein
MAVEVLHQYKTTAVYLCITFIMRPYYLYNNRCLIACSHTPILRLGTNATGLVITIAMQASLPYSKIATPVDQFL